MGWIIRTVDTLEEVAYYDGEQKSFGGPWGDPNQYEQVEVADRIPTEGAVQKFRGDYFVTAESIGTTSAMGTAYVNKLRLSTNDIPDEIPDGYFRLGFTFSWSISALGDNFYARIRQNGVTDVWTQASRSGVAINLLNPSSGCIYLTLDSGVYTFDLEFAAGLPTSSTTVSQAKLEFWRLY